MKLLFAALCLVTTVTFFSCSKNNGSPGGGPGEGPGSSTAEFHFDDTGDLCSRIVLHGSYFVNAPMTPTNVLTIKINVTKAGTISFNTDPINGYYFGVSDTFATGAQELTLQAFGMPLKPGNNTFEFGEAGNTFFQTVPVLQQAVQLEEVPEAIYARGKMNGANFDLTFSGDEDDVKHTWNSSDVIEVRSFIRSALGELMIQKQFMGGLDTATEVEFKRFFTPRAYPIAYSDNCGNTSDGVIISWTNDQGTTYTARPDLDQETSSFVIVGINDGHRVDGKYYIRVKARLTVNLYAANDMKRFEDLEVVSCFVFK